MNTLCIRNGRLIDPSQALDRVDELWIEGSQVHAIGTQPGRGADRVIDASGWIVCPGLIDMHVHLREPGREEDETIRTGTAAALAGGITSVACMPNTEPALDSQASAEFVFLQAQRSGQANVFPVGALTKGRQGAELAEIGGLVDGGAVALSDDDSPVVSAEMMRRGMEYCRMFDKAVLSHCENLDLTRGGIMHEGFESMRLGLRGLPAAAEEVMVYRDIALAELTGARLHILHVSTARSVDLIRRARASGIQVTGEVCPHHLALTDRSLSTFDSNYKMMPPLRTPDDIQALLAGLRDGTAGSDRQRSFAAFAREEDARAGIHTQRRGGPGDAPAGVYHGTDCAGSSDLAPSAREADHQPGPGAGTQSRYAQAGSHCRCDTHRSGHGLEYRSRPHFKARAGIRRSRGKKYAEASCDGPGRRRGQV